MKRIKALGIIIVISSLFYTKAMSELFLGARDSINSLVIATNEAILISSFKSPSDNFGESSSVTGQIEIQGTTNHFSFSGWSMVAPVAIAGPAIVSFPNETNSWPVCISYKRLSGTSIKSALLSNSQSTVPIAVPSGQTCHFFNPISVSPYNYSDVLFDISDGTNSVTNLPLYGGEEFTGPATISLMANPNGYGPYGGGSGDCTLISYYFTDDFTSLPVGVVNGGTGSFSLNVEKSSNLIDWSPVIIQRMSEDQQAFYRLKFSK